LHKGYKNQNVKMEEIGTAWKKRGGYRKIKIDDNNTTKWI